MGKGSRSVNSDNGSRKSNKPNSANSQGPSSSSSRNRGEQGNNSGEQVKDLLDELVEGYTLKKVANYVVRETLEGSNVADSIEDFQPWIQVEGGNFARLKPALESSKSKESRNAALSLQTSWDSIILLNGNLVIKMDNPYHLWGAGEVGTLGLIATKFKKFKEDMSKTSKELGKFNAEAESPKKPDKSSSSSSSKGKHHNNNKPGGSSYRSLAHSRHSSSRSIATDGTHITFSRALGKRASKIYDKVDAEGDGEFF